MNHVQSGTAPVIPPKPKRQTGNPWRGRVLQAEQQRHARQLAAREKHQRKQTVKGLPFHLQQMALGHWKLLEQEQGFNPATRWLNDHAHTVMTRMRERRSWCQFAIGDATSATGDKLHAWSSDDTVKVWARRRAAEAQAAAEKAGADVRDRYRATLACVEAHDIDGIAVPDLGTLDQFQAAAWRMSCPRWWRRKARRKLDLDIETEAIRAGHVRRGVSVYVSKRNLQRGADQQRRNQQLLMELVATNEEGHRFALSDLAEKSISNPVIRFSELMVRLKGCEALADSMGYVGMFYTWTLPSRFHSQMAAGGKNEKWDGSMPRDGHNYLVEQWALCRSSLAKLQARYFGVRVAEPHHDGCPHWHLLLFVKPEHAEAVTDMMRRYAMREAPEEKGALLHRFKVERIDKAKGGATSYVAKYVSKLTTGAGLKEGIERATDGKRRKTGNPAEGAVAARRWASVHRIRQFQFVGLPPVGIWRETRRLEETPTVVNGFPLAGMSWARIERARLAAGNRATAGLEEREDGPDYASHVRAMGGVVPRAEQKLMVARELDGTINAYGELRPPQTVGIANRCSFVNVRPGTVLRRRRSRQRKDGSVSVTLRKVQVQRREVITVQGLAVVTRQHQWVVSLRSDQGAVQDASSASAPPWTRVNNCNRLDPIGTRDEEVLPPISDFSPPGASPPPPM